MDERIGAQGLEVKVTRKFYKLDRVDKTADVSGSRGQLLKQNVDKFKRTEIKDLGKVKSGDLIEVEMHIKSKNDYEYVVIDDMKPAGCETVDGLSGWVRQDLAAYREFHDERVSFFVRSLARGEHSLSYRVRAEIPGLFNALPTQMNGVYAPELRANSNDFRIAVGE
jgi:uncharacterized protein YfaS (alpha-2-macroglobulin family)